LFDASCHFLTVGTGGGNSSKCGSGGLYIVVFGKRGSPITVPTCLCRAIITAEPSFAAQPIPWLPVVTRYIQQGRSRMSSQNQNPGQQNQNPGQKPGQQQGGGKKPGQQQQDPNRQE